MMRPCLNHVVRPRQVLLIVCLAELLAMTMWFTGTTAIPQLAVIWHISIAAAAPLTIMVQYGFVVGALLIALTNLADLVDAARLFALSALLAAASNAAFAFVAAEHRTAALALRFLTGMALAGVYPVGMKLITSWFKEGRGFALGALVGALTLGKASPHLIGALQGLAAHALPWRLLAFTTSGLALIAAILVAVFVRVGPYHAPVAFKIDAFAEFARNRRLLLANLGYLGHMWELYSMWAWIAVILYASARRSNSMLAAVPFIGDFGAFVAIGIGAIGCLWAGVVADRVAHASSSQLRIRSRATVAVVAMAVSATCCVLAGLLFDHLVWLLVLALVWGISVIADSAQFSAIISEVADQRYVGTALTIQTAVGFLLTTVSIKFAASFAQVHGWPAAMSILAIGPALGILAMLTFLGPRGLGQRP